MDSVAINFICFSNFSNENVTYKATAKLLCVSKQCTIFEWIRILNELVNQWFNGPFINIYLIPEWIAHLNQSNE